MLRPVPPYRRAHAVAQGDDSALQIRLLLLAAVSDPAGQLVTTAGEGQLSGTSQSHHRATCSRARERGCHPAPPTATVPGNYRSAAFGAQGVRWTPHLCRLSGSETAPRSSLQWRDSPSMGELARSTTTASRCRYERMKMERSTTQFVTRQLMERALDANRCGPPASRGAADTTIEAISRSAIFGH